ncbi:MAG: hypothetical protein PGN09_12765 [Sphingomonas fennica]
MALAAKAGRKPARWSAAIERKFLGALIETLNVKASARIAGTSETSVYRHRQQSEAFRAAWALAIGEGYARLELLMLERAVKGVTRPVFFGGKRIASVKEHSERAALALLARRRDEPGPEAGPPEDDATVRRRMTQRLEEMAARLAEAPAADGGGAGDPA